MKILGIDLETNGLDVQKCAVVEIGLCLWDTDRHVSLRTAGFLVNDTASPTYGDWAVCEKLSGITKADIDQFGIDPKQTYTTFRDFTKSADIILAANGLKFDKLVIDAYKRRYKIDTAECPWLDLYQFPFPDTCKHRNLLYLAAYYGFINPFPHRALSDTLTMMKIASNFDIPAIVQRQNAPSVSLVARVSYQKRALASERGFIWHSTRKLWYKVILESELEALTPVLTGYPFEVEFVEGNIS
jgi:DNA polymerase-3 subunit epsilon